MVWNAHDQDCMITIELLKNIGKESEKYWRRILGRQSGDGTRHRGALSAGPVWLGSIGKENLQEVPSREYRRGPSDVQVSRKYMVEGRGQQWRAIGHGMFHLYVRGGWW